MRKIYMPILITVALSLLCVSCKKSVTDCNFVVKPLVELTDKTPEEPATGAYAYAFFADTTQWLPTEKWADAEAGMLSSRNSDQTKKYDMKIELNEAGLLEIGPLTTLDVIIVVCDPANKIFAWRQAEIVENLSYIFVKVRFRPWKTSKSYIDSRWNMVSEFAPEPEPDPDPDPTPDPDPDPTPTPTPIGI